MVASVPNDIFQFSTFSALAAGFKTGQPRTLDLTSHGTDGIGAYENQNLMILYDGLAFTLSKDGSATKAPMNDRLPFAMITVFQPTFQMELPTSLDFKALDELIKSKEMGHARAINTLVPFKISGGFQSIKLVGAGVHQEQNGTMFGFIIPTWMTAISGPRIHAHFLSSSGDLGGRVEDFETGVGATLAGAKCGRFHLGFSQSVEWEDVGL